MLKKLVSILIILSMSFSGAVFATSLKKAEFTSIVEGSDVAAAGKKAAVLIYPSGTDLSVISSAATSAGIFEIVDYYREVTVGNDGGFAFEVLFDDKEKGYRDIKLSVDGNEEIHEKAVYVVTQNDINTFIGDINSTSAANEAFCTYLLESLPIISEENSEYFSNASLRLQTAKQLLSVRDFMYDKNFDTTAEIQAAFNMALLITQINLSETDDDIEALIEKYKSSSKLADICYMKYYADCKAEVHSKLNSASSLDAESFYNTLGEAIVLTAIKNVSNHNEITDVIKNVNDYLKLDISAYEYLADKSSVNKGIMTKTGSLSEFKSAFVSLVNEASYNSNRKPSSSPSGGGIGSISVNSPADEQSKPREYFNDLTGFDWAKDSINSLAELGIVSGVGKGMYEPARYVTREEYVKMIVEAFSQADLEAECDFSDINDNDWCYKYVATAVAKGYVNGTDENRFGKENEIKRQDAAVILARISGKRASQTASFGDMAEVSDYAIEAVNLMAQLKVINGNEYGDFNPHAPLSRAECAKVIFALYSQLHEVN